MFNIYNPLSTLPKALYIKNVLALPRNLANKRKH